MSIDPYVSVPISVNCMWFFAVGRAYLSRPLAVAVAQHCYNSGNLERKNISIIFFFISFAAACKRCAPYNCGAAGSSTRRWFRWPWNVKGGTQWASFLADLRMLATTVWPRTTKFGKVTRGEGWF